MGEIESHSSIWEGECMDLRLLELRREKQHTQEDVANYLKISRQAYALYETNQRHIYGLA